MALDAKSEKAFRDALDLLRTAKFTAAVQGRREDAEALGAEEINLIEAQHKEVEGVFASRTFYFNFIAARLGAANNILSADPYRDLKRTVQGRLLELRGSIMDAAVELIDDLQTDLIPEEVDDEVEDTGSVSEAPAPKTAKTTTAINKEESSLPAVPAPTNVTAVVTSTKSKVRADLRDEYETLFAECVIRPDRLSSVNWHIHQLRDNRERYEKGGAPLGVPWWFVGAIHMLETGFTFDKHLHNGDPLTARTVRVPKGRPRTGGPTFTWSQSAKDALTFKKLDKWDDWSVAGALYQWERFNGFGYRHHHPTVKTPYLWSFSNHYDGGKYVADGQFDANAVSKQCGAATVLRALVNRGIVVL